MSVQRSGRAAEPARPAPHAGEPAVPADGVEIERALARFSHLLNRSRRHGAATVGAGVPVDRAAVPVLRLPADSEPLRPGEVAGRRSSRRTSPGRCSGWSRRGTPNACPTPTTTAPSASG
ncbi:hypothetical protein GCM10022416_55520 [Actinomadura keratinilytica]|uniref:Uncharacterized protein n=1 Tax=Actinomadura keratinilytica TaxID=547461 RepID=A0ABP7ZEC4_9ACTN